VIEFWVSGRPAPQGSKRHVGNGRMVEMSKGVGPWREAVRSEAQRMNAIPVEGAVAVAVYFYFTAPKSVKRTMPSVRPDLDKLVRAVLDGLAMAGIFADDAQVTDLAASKRYGPRTGAVVRVFPVSDVAGAFADARSTLGLSGNPFEVLSKVTLKG
jgi:crossover junction endodeoxyribonuclease RusA